MGNCLSKVLVVSYLKLKVVGVLLKSDDGRNSSEGANSSHHSDNLDDLDDVGAPLEPEDIDEEKIKTVQIQVQCSRNKAINALLSHDQDVANAVLFLKEQSENNMLSGEAEESSGELKIASQTPDVCESVDSSTAPITRPLPSGHNVNRALQPQGADTESLFSMGPKSVAFGLSSQFDDSQGSSANVEVGANELMVACRTGDAKTVRRIFEKTNIDVNKKGASGLSTAAQMMQVRVKDGVTPLVLACGYGHVSVVQELLNRPAMNVNLDDGAALQEAAAKGYKNIVTLLLKDPSIDTKYMHRALDIAVRKGLEEIAQMLQQHFLSKGETVEISEKKLIRGKHNALVKACEKGDSKRAQKLLPQLPTDMILNEENYDSMVIYDTALSHAARHSQSEILQIIQDHLTNEGVALEDIESQIARGRRGRLKVAIATGKAHLVRELLRDPETNVMSFEDEDDNERTPLSLAYRNDHEDIAKMIEECLVSQQVSKEDIEKQIAKGLFKRFTNACYDGDSRAAKNLLTHPKIVPSLKIDDGITGTPLVHASMYGLDDVVELMKERLLSSGVSAENIEEQILNGLQKRLFNACDNHGSVSAKLGGTRETVVQDLLNHPQVDSFLNKKRFDNGTSGPTPLELASAEGQTKIVKLIQDHLLDKGVETKDIDKQIMKGLHKRLFGACDFEGDVKVVQELLLHPRIDTLLQMTKYDWGGETPLEAAVERGHTKIVELIQDHMNNTSFAEENTDIAKEDTKKGK